MVLVTIGCILRRGRVLEVDWDGNDELLEVLVCKGTWSDNEEMIGDEIGGNDELLEVEKDGFMRRNEKLQVYRSWSIR